MISGALSSSIDFKRFVRLDNGHKKNASKSYEPVLKFADSEHMGVGISFDGLNGGNQFVSDLRIERLGHALTNKDVFWVV